MGHPLLEGVYESLRTDGLEAAVEALTGLTPRWHGVEPADAPHVLARHVAESVERRLAELRDPGERLALVNELLDRVAEPGERVRAHQQLAVLSREVAPGVHRLQRPVTPLSSAALLTNGPEEPSLGAELRAELGSADRVDLLCAFVRWHGIRVLADELAALRERGVPLRVITTTYVGATEQRAVDELVRRYGAEVRGQLRDPHDPHDPPARQGVAIPPRLRLHDGVRRQQQPLTVGAGRRAGVERAAVRGRDAGPGAQVRRHVRQLLGRPVVRPLRPRPSARRRAPPRGARARRRAVGRLGAGVRPYPHQEQILEALAAERDVHDRHRNLVVAATGTGKTVVAALDYARTGDRPRLLFVAHRREILEQSLRTYREVLADGAFGELYVGGDRAERWEHVFASVHSLAAHGVERIPAGHFDVVVVDEFHHAEAPTYRRLLEHLTPREPLGLTATPERTDGTDVRSHFAGRTAFELRVWDALRADLLVPFHYFGVADGVDLAGLAWTRGSYDVTVLDNVYTGDDARARKILRETADKVTDVRAMRALGFCVSVRHAQYMAGVFTRAGIPSRAVTGETPPQQRADALRALRERELNCLFTVDLFNEGLDLPEVDTVLLLRPTQSATVFLQQLGRGLRRAPGKAVLTVLDFIGQHRREFRFDVRYCALTGTSRRQLERDVETGFPFLPSGSQMVLDTVAQRIVLDDVRAQLRLRRRDLVADVRSHGDLSLAGCLAESGRELVDVHGRGSSWTALRREAGLPTPDRGPDEDALLKRMVGFAHVDDPQRAAVYARLATVDGPRNDELTPHEQVLARMLFFVLWPDRGGHASYDAGLARLRTHPAVCAEIGELVAMGADAARHVPRPLGPVPVPLLSHAHYRREEVLAALGWASMERKAHGHATGVAWAPATATDALLVNLRKTERAFSPTTMYRDYAIGPDLFHWESQNATSLASETGRRYVGGGTHVALFVRESPTGELGPVPFLCLGLVDHVEHTGERPMAITWRLRRAMPAETFQAARVVAS